MNLYSALLPFISIAFRYGPCVIPMWCSSGQKKPWDQFGWRGPVKKWSGKICRIISNSANALSDSVAIWKGSALWVHEAELMIKVKKDWWDRRRQVAMQR